MKKFYRIEDTRLKATGYWVDIFYQLCPPLRPGLEGDKFTCPICQQSLMRVDITSETGETFCACGSRRGFDVISDVLSISFIDTVHIVGEFLDKPTFDRDKNQIAKQIKQLKKQRREQAIEWNYKVAEGVKKLKWGNAPKEIKMMLLDWGLTKRKKIILHWKVIPKSLYGKADERGYIEQPCLISFIVNKKMKPISVQMIPIEGDKSMTTYTEDSTVAYMPIWGKPKPAMSIAEGLKTSIAAGRLFSCKVTPCVDANHLIRYPFQSARVFADKDRNKIGLYSAREYCDKMKIPYSSIQLPSMKIPKGSKGVDFYDQLKKERNV